MNPVSEQSASILQLLGAGGFGLLIGWYIYYINRYRKGDVQFTDLVTLIGIIGGTAVLALFPARTDLFGAFGIGLAAGFFLYFFVLARMVRTSENFNVDWFLDGRRTLPDGTIFIPDDNKEAQGGRAMSVKPVQPNQRTGGND